MDGKIKYTFFIVAVVIIIVILSAGKVINEAVKPLTIEDITGHSVEECSIVRSGYASKQKKKSDVNDFKSKFSNKEFKSINVEADQTASAIYYICQAASGENLFTIVDVGNNSDYYIKAGSFDIKSDANGNLYQRQ